MPRRKQPDSDQNAAPAPKRRRRGKGEGTVYQRQSDKRWVTEITLEDGSRKALYGKTQEEVIAKKRQAEYEMKQGRFATGPQQKLADHLEHWFESVHKPPMIKLTTHVTQRKMVNKHILPALGHIQLRKLTTRQLDALYSRKLEEGLASGSIRLLHGILHEALEAAIRWQLITRNVCNDVTLPRVEKREVQPLDKEQAVHLLKAIKGHELEVFLTVALVTGMRHGELCALKWQDINFDEGTLYVWRTVSYITGHGFVETDPKTAKSKRKILLPSVVLDLLKQHHRHCLEIRLKAGSTWQERDLVFSDKSGGFLNPDTLRRKFYKILEKAGLPKMHIHDLRHSAATILLSMGVSMKVIQELLGHSQISMTMGTYSHVLPSMQKDMKEKWDDFFGG